MKGLRVMVIRLAQFSMTALAAVSLLIQSGCIRSPSRIVPPSIDADAAGQEAIKMYDTNKDGKISGAEFDKVPSLKQLLPGVKSLRDKGVTAADITARLKAWQATRVGRIGSVNCHITRNGKPLAGAEVKFVPEKFLGTNMPVCTGTTGLDGYASMSAPVSGPDDVPGVPPGFYRVEVTKPGENIPAKFNTQTIFGDEVAPDIMRMTGYDFDLK